MLHQRHQHLSTKVWSRVWSSLARRLSTLSKVWRHPRKAQGYMWTYQKVRALLRWWSHQWVRETPAGAGPMLLPGPPCYTQTQPLNGQLVSFCCRISHSRLPGISTTIDHASDFQLRCTKILLQPKQYCSHGSLPTLTLAPCFLWFPQWCNIESLQGMMAEL